MDEAARKVMEDIVACPGGGHATAVGDVASVDEAARTAVECCCR